MTCVTVPGPWRAAKICGKAWVRPRPAAYNEGVDRVGRAAGVASITTARKGTPMQSQSVLSPLRATNRPRGSGRWDPSSLMDIAGYVSIGAGYLVAVVANNSLTPLGLILQTVGSAAWLWLFWQVSSADRSPRRTLLLTLTMIVLTLGIEQLVWLGGGFDWLLPMVMVSVLTIFYPFSRALVLGSGVWLVTLLTLLRLDAGRSFVSDLGLIGPGFIFVFAF